QVKESTAANRNVDALEQAKRDIARLEKKIADEEKSAAQKKESAPAPTATPTPAPAPLTVLPNRQAGMGCVLVQISGPGAQAMVGYRVECVEQGTNPAGAPMQEVRQGTTNAMGRWRQCGIRIGNRLVIRVTGPNGASAGVKQVTVADRVTFVDFQVGAEPDTAPSRPGRKPRFWRKPGE